MANPDPDPGIDALDRQLADTGPLLPFAVGRSGLVVILEPDAIKAACAARGWSLARLASAARISRPTLAAVLRRQPVRPLTAWKLARALSQSPEPADLSSLLRAA